MLEAAEHVPLALAAVALLALSLRALVWVGLCIRLFSARLGPGLVVIAALCIGALFGALTGVVLRAGGTTGFDAAVSACLAPYRFPWLLHAFLWLTALGTDAALVGVAVAATGFLWAHRRAGLILPLWVTFAGAQATTWIVKYAVNRARPLSLEGLAAVISPSFPSAHASGSVATYGLVAYALTRDLDPRQRREVASWTAFLIALIGFSRVVLGVHFATDVAGGFLVGGFWLLVGVVLAESPSERLPRIEDPPRSRCRHLTQTPVQGFFNVSVNNKGGPPMTHGSGSCRERKREWAAWGGGVLLLGALGAVTSATAQTTSGAPGCSVGALTGVVPGVTIVSATSVAATSPIPAYCDVIGTLDTSGDGAPVGSAGFELRLPDNWNGKFLFFGVGGLAGSTYADNAANPVDVAAALPKGYATAITDTGHLGGGTDASWALVAPGKPDRPKVADYYYRATHEVTVAGKRIVEAYYGNPVGQSYFDGCSNGGRQAMIEAARYPEDYDGIIAGAPFQDIRTILGGLKDAKALFATPSSYLPASLLPTIDAAVYAACDALDGVKDGLIQNPAACTFKPSDLVCAAGQTGNCLTQDQANFLTTYISPVRTEAGELIYPGFSITDLSNGGLDAWTVGTTPPTAPGTAEPWGDKGFAPAPLGFQFVDHIVKYLVTYDPTYDIFTYPIGIDGVVTPEGLALFDARTARGSAATPEDFQTFINQGRKLLWYHGYSDPALPPFRSVLLYEQLAALAQGSYAGLQDNIRLFMVPDMQHCGGGPGPNRFDTLSALDAWVTQGQAPNGIVATHYQNNDPTQPVTRTMPLCEFPEQATYNGTGDVNQASSWSCTQNSKLLDVGPDGEQAGLTAGG